MLAKTHDGPKYRALPNINFNDFIYSWLLVVGCWLKKSNEFNWPVLLLLKFARNDTYLQMKNKKAQVPIV